jgi:hypothetical protein
MELKIEDAALVAAVGQTMRAGLEAGVGAWEVKSEVTKRVTEAIMAARLPELLHAELSRRLDAEAAELVRGVVEEVLPHFRTAFLASMRGALVAMVAGLRRGKPSYMGTEEGAAWAAAEREVYGSPVSPAKVDGLPL